MNPNITVPLEQLRLSSRNARKTGGDDVADMAASIAAGGLLQNLVVIDGPDGYEVIAGGRRLKAMQQLAREGRLPQDLLTDGVPCRRLTDEEAIEASTAENTIRVPMHPADQFEAFQAMIDAGREVPDVAEHFGTTEIMVKRRLRLAKVAPEILAEYRAGTATLEQITALAITEDREAQRLAWAAGATDRYARHPERLRALLTEREIRSTNYRVRLVGLDTYEAAGGAVRHDLFDDTGGGYVLDEPLLDRLVQEKLQAVVDSLTAEGWSFVKVDTSDKPWQFRDGCDVSQPKRVARELSDPEAAELKAAKARKDALDAEFERPEDLDEWVEDDDPRAIEHQQLEDRIRFLESFVEIYSPRQMAKAGCQVMIDKDRGAITVNRGLVPKKPAAQHAADTASAEARGEAPPAKDPQLAETMIRRLTAHKTIAIQSGLMANADVALALLAHALLSSIWYHGRQEGGSYALHVSASQQLASLDRLGFNDVTNSPHLKHTQEALQQLRHLLKVPEREEALLPWLLSQNRNTVISLLAAVAVYTVDAIQGREGEHASDKVLEALGIDMADYWQPTADTFFSIVPRALGLQAIGEAFDATHPTAARLLSGPTVGKAEFAGAAEAAMSRSGWLPKPLRRPGYLPRTKKVGAVEDKATPTLKNAAAKKPAVKSSAAGKAAAAKSAPKKSAAKLPATKKARKGSSKKPAKKAKAK